MQYQPQQDVIRPRAQTHYTSNRLWDWLFNYLQQMFRTSIFLALGQTMLAIIVEYTMRLNYIILLSL